MDKLEYILLITGFQAPELPAPGSSPAPSPTPAASSSPAGS
jgi:hypothetical protein